jgi:uncharacterized spore protein YtfJ
MPVCDHATKGTGRKEVAMATDVEQRARQEVADQLLARIGHAIGDRARASAVFGEPVDREGVTVIPVAKARFGFGAGGGSGPEKVGGAGGGGGGGAMISPLGYIEVRAGGAEYKRISRATDALAYVAAASLAALALKRLLD